MASQNKKRYGINLWNLLIVKQTGKLQVKQIINFYQANEVYELITGRLVIKNK